MKILIPFLIVLVLLTGCISLEEAGSKVLAEDGNIYETDDILSELNFNIPKNINIKDGFSVSFSYKQPDGETSGTYKQSYYSTKRELAFTFPGFSLYYPGMWEITYTFSDLEGNRLFEGFGTIYVKPKDKTLASFEVVGWECPSEASGTFFVNFSIKNVGRESGRVYIYLFNTRYGVQSSKVGQVWYSTSINLEDGLEHVKRVEIPILEDDVLITLRYNEKEYTQLVRRG